MSTRTPKPQDDACEGASAAFGQCEAGATAKGTRSGRRATRRSPGAKTIKEQLLASAPPFELMPDKPKRTSRREALIKALQRKRPQSADQLGKRLGLLPHSVRAAISGLRKAGMTVVTTKTAGGTRYRLVALDAVGVDQDAAASNGKATAAKAASS
ncbi:DUF3489 domain-containing protein [Yoonia sp. GPGPB17]|uniref:DUF3489 domain-containing protein n=1 Tax=Yoonia sp. GPGPB17 TaxID=3026147 RepID=UPI0030C39CC4